MTSLHRSLTLPRSTFRVMLLLTCCAMGSGCPWTTRYPNLQVEHPEASRQVSQTQDPFPDSHLGPQTGFRPLGFSQQRSEAQIAKSRNYASWLRIQSQPTQGMPINPGLPTGYAQPPHPGAAAYPAQPYVGQLPPGQAYPGQVPYGQPYPGQPYPAMAYPPQPSGYPVGVPYQTPYYGAPAPALR